MKSCALLPNQLALLQMVREILRGTLGAIPPRSRNTPPLLPGAKAAPIAFGLGWGIVYAAVFALLPWLVSGLPRRPDEPGLKLVLLSLWGAGYISVAVIMARITSVKVLYIIEYGIIPQLSSEIAAAISGDLGRRFGAKHLNIVALGGTFVSTLLAGCAIYYDLFQFRPVSLIHVLNIVMFLVGMSILFFTAARTTHAATFYSCFMANINNNNCDIYKIDPANSSLVAEISTLGRHILLFWFGISLSIFTLLFMFHTTRAYVFIILLVPIANFFALVVGTRIFLSSEQYMRDLVNSVRRSTLRGIEAEINDLYSRHPSADETTWKRMTDLIAIQTEMSQKGRYQTSFRGIIVGLTPFVAPTIAVLTFLVGLQQSTKPASPSFGRSAPAAASVPSIGGIRR